MLNIRVRSITVFAALLMVVLNGCLQDPNTVFQVRPETVLAPQNPKFIAPFSGYQQYSSPPSGTLLASWNRSIADTQLNFKGYYVELWTSDTSGSSIEIGSGSGENLDSLVDTASIYRVGGKIADTFYLFKTMHSPNIKNFSTSPITLGRYTIRVSGIKTTAADTVIGSMDTSEFSSLFDPLPMANPTNLQATSINPTTVLLKWTPSVTGHDTGFYQYVAYYRDTSLAHDTGHEVLLSGISKWGNDSEAQVSVPGSNEAGSVTQEWPYEFWIKSERIDSQFYYGSLWGPDTNGVVWAGAANVPQFPNDTGHAGFLLVPSDSNVYLGATANSSGDMILNSAINNAFQVQIANNIVTLVALNGTKFSARQDFVTGLDSIFYTSPYDNPNDFTETSFLLPTTLSVPSGDTTYGVICYMKIPDPNLNNTPEYARLFIRWDVLSGSFLNPKPLGDGIDIEGSFQPGVSTDGSAHLPFY
ncbi:MAG TPA: hypothetical protein VGM92_12130 [Candidatus Kapabacteria bacterium]|jgi:hypothetical protein